MGVVAKVHADSGAGRVHPNVPGNSIGRFLRAENMIVKESLPNRRMSLPLDMKSAGLLNRFHELRKVAERLKALHQEMDVVRHKAVGVNCKRLTSRFCGEREKKIGARFRVKKYLSALETAEGNKVASTTQIIWAGKANWPAREWHGKNEGFGFGRPLVTTYYYVYDIHTRMKMAT